MEKYRCKLCLKSFANGRALGGHMRSHMLNLYVPSKTQQLSNQLGEPTESASSSSSSSEEEEEENEDKGLSYELRENPKKSFRWVDPEFSFAVDAGSVILQDRESETESSRNPIRRRSKRIRKSGISEQHQCHDQHLKQQLKLSQLSKIESSWVDPEPVSSISDTIPEEDVAYCLMMLSRDKWMREKDVPEAAKKYIDDHSDESDHEIRVIQTQIRARARVKYKCDTCDKVFRSYQALGGHRASHKKIKPNNNNHGPSRLEQSTVAKENAGNSTIVEKIHECPVCYRVFSSGQALGGHKRSHVINSSGTIATKPVAKHGVTLIDLNLPAPMDEDEFSQIELSAVSDAEFVNPIK